MQERFSPNPKEELSRASMEGNVYMPQNGLNIAIRTAERVLSQEDPELAIAELVAPIPNDETLEKRTAKANAQHRLHGIGRELIPNEVRQILIGGNLATLNLIASAVDIRDSLPPSAHSSLVLEDGEWADEPTLSRATEVSAALTPQKVMILRTLLQTTKDLLDSTEIKQLLTERKTLYRGWEHMDASERSTAEKQIRQLSNQVIEIIKDEFFHLLPEFDDKESRQMGMNLLLAVEGYMRHF